MGPRTEIRLRPGELHFGGDGDLVRTLLGSCVAITIWHPRARVGGMCHFLVPTRGRSRPDAETRMDGRYGDEAMHLLDRRAWDICTSLSDYQVRMYGGGNQFSREWPTGSIDISARNIEAAQYFSEVYGLTVLTTDLGGQGARDITLDLATGIVASRRVGCDLRASS